MSSLHFLSLALVVLVGACAHTRHSAPSPRVEHPPVAVGEDCNAESSIDVRHHDVDLTLTLDPPSLAGCGDVRVRARRDTTRVGLDARDLHVSHVRATRHDLRFTQVGARLCIELPTELRAGDELAISVEWQGSGVKDTPRFRGDQVWAGYRASAWMPTRDDPAQRATLALRITAPEGLRVAASGRFVGRRQNAPGLAQSSFVLDRPSPPFLFAFAAGRFDESELYASGVRLRAFGPPGSDLRSPLEITVPMLRFLQERTGASYPAEEYLQVFVKGDAAQEGAGLSFIAASALDDVRKDPTEDWVFAHELAHQWFAWLVPCVDFADFWLNEGFATFLVAAMKEQRWGSKAYDREVELWRTRSAKVHDEGKDAPVSLSDPRNPNRHAPRDSELQPRGVTYARGALVLHKLRAELGDAAFWSGLRLYVKTFSGQGARTEDLRFALESSAGRDLTAFFARWVYASAPDL